MFTIDFTSIADKAVTALAQQKLQQNLAEWERHIWNVISQISNDEVKELSVTTSGSTGAPKQITVSKPHMFNSAEMTCKALKLKEDQTALLCIPANKIGGIMMIVRAYCYKLRLVCVEPSSTPLSSLNNDLKIDFGSFTPMQFHEIITSEIALATAGRIGQTILGGQAVSYTLQQAVSKLINPVYSTYGMTETISHVALKLLNGNQANEHYKTLPGIKVDNDERNCLVIQAPQIGQPYLVTNDVARLISETEFEWIGRADNVINSGGVKIYPEEIEQSLQTSIPAHFFIARVEDEKLGQKIVLVVEAVDISDKTLDVIKQGLLLIDKIKRPKEILLADRFVVTETGKVKRAESLKIVLKRLVL